MGVKPSKGGSRDGPITQMSWPPFLPIVFATLLVRCVQLGLIRLIDRHIETVRVFTQTKDIPFIF